MRHKQASEALRRALALPFSLMACGGQTGAAESAFDAGSPRDGAPSTGCTLVSDVPKSLQVDCSCTATYGLVWPTSACTTAADGSLSNEQCAAVCPATNPCASDCPSGEFIIDAGISGCSVLSSPTSATIFCSYPGFCSVCATGRRPEGLSFWESGPSRTVAGTLAEMAWLEAASVPAFERLLEELSAHGASSELCEAARRAARDEVRHARVVSALAEEAGARVPEALVGPFRRRSLEAIATENAVEGCVRETFGAAVAGVQAKRASNPRVRAAMRGIAREEARHAQLAWAVADWLDLKLDADARRRVRRARDRAGSDLLRAASVEPDPVVARELGLPRAHEARAMALSLRASLESTGLGPSCFS